MTSFAPRPLAPQARAGDGRDVGSPDVSADPYDVYWVDAARRAFTRHWHEDHDAIDTATECYK